MFALLLLFATIFSQINIYAMEVAIEDYDTQSEDYSTEEEQFACIVEDCDRKYTEKLGMRRHLMKKHTDYLASVWQGFNISLIYKYKVYSAYINEDDVLNGLSKCNFCNFMRFVSKNNTTFTVHQQSCKGFKGTKCSGCFKKFDANSMPRHYTTKHKKILKKSVVGKESIPFNVSGFAKYLNTIEGLNIKYLYKCENCGDFFINAASAPRHLKRCL